MKLDMRRLIALPALALLASPAFANNNDGAVLGVFALLIMLGLFALAALVYFVPTFVAYYRKSANMTAVVLVNLLLGWSMIGWIVALILAFAGDSGAQAQRHREMMEVLRRNQGGPNQGGPGNPPDLSR